jgi:hypothetical protein
VPALQEKGGHREGVQVRARGASRLRARDRRRDVALDQRLRGLDECRIPVRERNGLGQDPDQPRLGHAVGVERGCEVGPGDRGDDRLEGDARDRGVPHSAAAEREPERSDLGVGDVAPRGEPVEEVLRVLYLLRAVEPELAARAAGAPRVASERREAELRHRRPDGLHVRARAPQSVEEDHSGPAALRCGAARDEIRARKRARVRSVDRDVGPTAGGRSGRRPSAANEHCRDDGGHDPSTTHERTLPAPLRWSQWIRVPWASSTPASEA